MNRKEKIVSFIHQQQQTTLAEIVEHTGLYITGISRHLRDLVQSGIIEKTGKVPKVYYRIASQTNPETLSNLTYKQIQMLDQHYYSFDSDGTLLQGHQWFVARCSQRNLDPYSQAELYWSILSHIENIKTENGLIPGTKTLSEKLGEVYLDELFFVEAYQIGHFGRSKLGSMTFYGKQSQNKSLIKSLLTLINRPLQKYIQEHNIDAVCYAPPSIHRSVQLMTAIQKGLSLDLPIIKLSKAFPNGVIIPQKSLKSMQQRIKNAENTIFLSSPQKSYDTVLLIDDFVGSGATLNIMAKKLKQGGYAKKVLAISLLGNIDTEYEVVNEV
jgi:Winged helix-turn-helix DNA-binding